MTEQQEKKQPTAAKMLERIKKRTADYHDNAPLQFVHFRELLDIVERLAESKPATE